MNTNHKGAWAEAEIVAAAVRLDLCVLRPLREGRRYDIVIDLEPRMLRVQCKWASRMGDVLGIRTSTSRHTPRGYVRTTYSLTEIDAFAAYSPALNRCYLVPATETEGQSYLHLRLAPTRNNQAQGVRWAADYAFDVQIDRLRHAAAADSPRGPLRRGPTADTIRSVQGL
jgi:hypothetical protein